MPYGRFGLGVFVLVLGLLSTTTAQESRVADLGDALQRIGSYVEGYYSRAQRVVSQVNVRVQPTGRDFTPIGRARQLLYELRVEWVPGEPGSLPEPIVMRDLVEADGRPPRPGDDLECTDPKLVSPEPLGMLLPERQHELAFTWRGWDREGGRDAVVLEYESLSQESPTVTWDDSCVSVDVPGLTAGRVWADARSGDVLRLDEHLIRRFEFPVPADQAGFSGSRWMALEQADSSVRYRPVRFEDPDETVMLPARIDFTTVWANVGTQRLHVTERFSDYRRFVTDSRIIVDPSLP